MHRAGEQLALRNEDDCAAAFDRGAVASAHLSRASSDARASGHGGSDAGATPTAEGGRSPGDRAAGFHGRRSVDPTATRTPQKPRIPGLRLAPGHEHRPNSSHRKWFAGTAPSGDRQAPRSRVHRRLEPGRDLRPSAGSHVPRPGPSGDHAREPDAHGRRRQLGQFAHVGFTEHLLRPGVLGCRRGASLPGLPGGRSAAGQAERCSSCCSWRSR